MKYSSAFLGKSMASKPHIMRRRAISIVSSDWKPHAVDRSQINETAASLDATIISSMYSRRMPAHRKRGISSLLLATSLNKAADGVQVFTGIS